ncbi:hypothetical protein D9M72_636960 [compost metagenome]
MTGLPTLQPWRDPGIKRGVRPDTSLVGYVVGPNDIHIVAITFGNPRKNTDINQLIIAIKNSYKLCALSSWTQMLPRIARLA